MVDFKKMAERIKTVTITDKFDDQRRIDSLIVDCPICDTKRGEQCALPDHKFHLARETAALASGQHRTQVGLRVPIKLNRVEEMYATLFQGELSAPIGYSYYELGAKDVLDWLMGTISTEDFLAMYKKKHEMCFVETEP